MTELDPYSQVSAAPTSDAEVTARFIRMASSLRSGGWAASAPSPEYIQLILAAVRGRANRQWVLDDDSSERGLATGCLSHAPDLDCGLLGLFEVRQDMLGLEAGARILEEAARTAKAWGVSRIFAPVDGNTVFNYRLQTENPSELRSHARSWEPLHPPHILPLLERQGFRPVEEYVTRGFDFSACRRDKLQLILDQTGRGFRAALEKGFLFTSISTPTEAKSGLEKIGQLNERCFRDSFLYEPVPAALFLKYYEKISQKVDYRYTWLCQDSTGALAGYVFAFREGSSLIIKTVAVDPRFRSQKLSSALIHLSIEKAFSSGLNEVVSALVREGNTSEFLSERDLPEKSRVWTHRYSLFGKPLP